MSMLLYLHGFNSSPQSKKAIETERWLQLNAPNIKFFCPQLSPYASTVMQSLAELIEAYLPQPVYL
ncbi:MAG: YqiA/YcfP family alpha/beta fold hydrolase, partial [Porticoccaceae bacterium]